MLPQPPRAYVIDFSAVPIVDATAAATIEGFVRRARRRSAAVWIAGAEPSIRRELLVHGARLPAVRFRSTLADAVAGARGDAARAPADGLPRRPDAAQAPASPPTPPGGIDA